MGYELPAALGAVLSGKVEGHTIAVIGDGTYLMAHASELVTAIQEGVSFTTIVLVNNGWQCIRSFQEGAFGEEFGTQFRLRDGDQSNLTGPVVTVDHAGTARSYGAEAYDVYNRDELRAALDKARNASGPVVIAAHTSTEDLPFGAEAWWEFGSPDADAPEGLAPVRERFLEAAQNHLWYV
jgi:3D-(3,5/4)-trihydroxycyclohexane-1,2-dione acylhydrolase (decyclizing)